MGRSDARPLVENARKNSINFNITNIFSKQIHLGKYGIIKTWREFPTVKDLLNFMYGRYNWINILFCH